MTFCESILGKKIDDLTPDDLKEFFVEGKEETALLEFKEGTADIEKLHKEVVAFLNTEGGLLIYGAPREEEVVGKNIKISKGVLVPSKVKSQDIIMHSLGAHISPAPEGIRIKTLPFPNGSVYILQIPQSLTPPHQVNRTGTYYLRLEREAKPAPHGIVEALFNRRQVPNLVGKINILKYKDPQSIRFDFILENKSRLTAEKIGIMIQIEGVKEVITIKNLNNNFILKNDTVDISMLDNNLLVQGLNLSFSITVKLRQYFGLVSFSYFCKGGKLKTNARLISTAPVLDIKYFDGESYPDPSTGDANIYQDFINMRMRKHRELLEGFLPINSILSDPASLDSINELGMKLGIEFPESYLEFLFISDGFKGYIGNIEFELFSVDVINERQTKLAFEIYPYIVVGLLAGYPIRIEFGEDNSYLFKWVIADKRANDLIERSSLSFFDLFESVYDFSVG